MQQERIQWLDSYKGILISFIVFIHIFDIFPVYEPLHKLFAGMRMPAFFFISGYLLSSKYQRFIPFFQHRFHRLIIPYFIFFALTLVFWKLFEFITHLHMVDSMDLLKGMVAGLATSNLMFTASALWFVLALFIAELYYMTLVLFVKNDVYKVFVLLCFALVAYMLGNHLGFRLPWNADAAFMGAVFYGLGNLSKRYSLLQKIHIESSLQKAIVLILLLCISAYLSFHSINEYAKSLFDNPLYTLLSAISGIIALIYLASFSPITHSKTLQYLGANSYVILAFHAIPIYIAQRALDKLTDTKVLLPDNPLLQGLIGIPFLLLVLLCMFPLIYLINKKASFILGQSS